MKKSLSVKELVLYLLLAIVFIVLTVCVFLKKELAIDNFFYNLIVVNMRTPLLNKLMIGMTYLSGFPAYIVLFIILFIA